VFVHSPALFTKDPKQLHEYHEEQLAKGLEGVVAKMADGVYQSGRKGYSWVKIKESEGQRGKLSDTVDCVVMGYYLAKGSRSSFQVGAVLAGVMNKDGEIVTISRVGSGFSEDLAKEFIERSKKVQVDTMPKMYNVSKGQIPDVWLDPQIVIEVAADEITTSPMHTAGVALRFPRIIRFRDDKTWEQITTLEEVKQIGL
jgi:DNA ligase-1